MSDLPPPHSLPEYARPSNKIKIRPPQAAHPTASSSTIQNPKSEPAVSSSLFLRVPAQNTKPVPQVAAPAAPVAPIAAPSLPSTVPAPKKAPAPKVSTAVQPQAPTPKLPAQAVSFINANPSHYPNASYLPQAAAASTSTTSATPPILRASSIMNALSASQSPAPVLSPNHQLKSVSLRIEPQGRTFDLDHKLGVKSWAVRLMPGETTILLSNVSFLGDEEDESSGDEEADVEKHEEEEDADMDVDVEADPPLPVKNGRKKGKGRGRGRPAKVSTVTTRQAAAKTMKQPKKTPPKIGEVQVKLNGSLVKEQAEQTGQWSISVSVGSSVVEVGEVGGMLWKVYLQRTGPV
jgi:chromatin structure-remodeling complex subunit RSC4